MKLLQQLWDLAEREGQKRSVSPNYVFGNIGLWLNDIKEFSNYNYWHTPINSTTFAHTGGDGVHFGFLHIDGKLIDESPVVMTVPSMANVIIGENLLEFLCLGSEVGYFVLEQIVYGFRKKSVADWFSDHQNDMEDENKELLQLLREEFNLKPWSNVEARLDELQKQYLLLIKLKEDT